MDTDEAVVGLIARDLSPSFSYPVFYPAQEYAGAISLPLYSASIRLLGNSEIGLRLPNLLFYLALSYLVFDVTSRRHGRQSTLTAVALLSVWPPDFVWWSTRSYLFYNDTLVLGMAALTVATHAQSRRMLTSRLSFCLGLLLGLGWWSSPNIVYYALPVVVLLSATFLTDWHASWNQHHHPGLLSVLFSLSTASWTVGNVVDRFWYFFTDGLPFLFGYKDTLTRTWNLGDIGLLAYSGTLILFAAGLFWNLQSRAAKTSRWQWILASPLSELIVASFVFSLNLVAIGPAKTRYLFSPRSLSCH